ncbi:CHAT domain-containing tetratricopeptide repeat protein [Micromonospora sp. NBC_01796]|uniref:CHAT domain-containing tetratricopeptide repeat protein n=1 Tax=Micromonospora sp. NBC_01796 TaxID=2975987 RepID=UPI002DDAD92A|nr:CHAT domain-containing protein [Micromonospora sp. NBC_01796]WSA87928.1 CHAT domain-containing protein [Micromonospora sp. NBC_01796]
MTDAAYLRPIPVDAPAPQPEPDLAELTAEIDETRGELATFDSDPQYRECLLAGYRAERLYELGRLLWRRYLVVVEPPDADPDACAEALRVAMEALEEARDALPIGTGLGVDIAWWLGGGWADRYLTDADPDALDQVIGLSIEVAEAGGLTSQDEAQARYRLAESLLERHGLRLEPADLDRAVVEAELAAGLDAPSIAGEISQLWPAAVLASGLARCRRWHQSRDRDDLDAAIGHLARLAQLGDPAGTGYGSGGELTAAALGDLAQLHHDRAALLLADDTDRTAAGEELSAGRHWVRIALDRCTHDDPIRPRILAARAFLGWAHYQYGREVSELDTVARELIEVIEVTEDDGEREALTTMQGMVTAERAACGLPVSEDDQAVLRQAFSELNQSLVDQVKLGNAYRDPRADPSISPRVAGLFPAQRGVEHLDRAIAEWSALPVGSPKRAELAGTLASAAVLAQQYGYRDLDHDLTIEMIILARTERPDDPQWQMNMLVLRGTVGTLAADRGRADQIGPALEALTEARRLATENGRESAEIDLLIATAKRVQANLNDDLSATADLIRDHESLAGRADLNEQQRLLLRLQDASTRAQRAFQRRDRTTLDAAVAELRAGLALLPVGDVRRGLAAANLTTAELWRSQLGDDDSDTFTIMRRAADQFAAAAAEPGVGGGNRSDMVTQSILLRAGAAVADRDAVTLAQQITLLQERLDAMPTGDPGALRLRVQLGSLYLVRLEGWRDFADADRAVAQLEPARPYVDPTHPLWSATMSWLSRAYRARDDRTRDDRGHSRDTGLQALRGYVWRTLVQSGTEEAALAGRSVIEDAAEVANWCVLDNEPSQAVRALDACRGLVLQAASRGRDVPALLTAAQQPDLAAQWRAGGSNGGPVPAGTRQRVMRVLLDHERSLQTGARIELLDPPDLAEITASLRSSGTDALVYLVPASDGQRPVAVVVPAAGDPEILALPTLAARFTALDGYLATRLGGRRVASGTRDAGPVDPTEPTTSDPESGQTLQKLSDWAWYAAMEQILQYCAGHGFSRPYRLVLVPMDAFGLVPWHAARAPGGRYVIEDATLSYAVSARMFCATTARDPIPSSADSLIVGNPTGDLRHAGLEAVAIRDTIYRSSPYLGRRDDNGATGRGSPGEVLEWLRTSLGADRGVLHLACHGVIVPSRPESSYLVLNARSGPAPLTAERLADEAHRSEGGFRLSAVVLAACSSGVPGRTYDEAFSLATVFLMAGARSVIGSLWPVPDEATSLLMYMLHHYLIVDRMGSAQALRMAQLWMLDPERRTPPEMPLELRDQVGLIREGDLEGWAGFSHLGQW